MSYLLRLITGSSRQWLTYVEMVWYGMQKWCFMFRRNGVVWHGRIQGLYQHHKSVRHWFAVLEDTVGLGVAWVVVQTSASLATYLLNNSLGNICCHTNTTYARKLKLSQNYWFTVMSI